MRLLLDTHIILWSAVQPRHLPEKIAAELRNPANDLWFSSISVWEVFVLAEKGRIECRAPIEKTIRKMFRMLPMREAPVNQEVAIQSRLLDLPHQDPADRFIAATAMVYDLTLVTIDSRIRESKLVPVLP